MYHYTATVIHNANTITIRESLSSTGASDEVMSDLRIPDEELEQYGAEYAADLGMPWARTTIVIVRANEQSAATHSAIVLF